MVKNWIQRATKKHKGNLRRWAERHDFIRGKRINLARAERYAKRKGLAHRLREIRLARTLRRLR